jgi:L-amino acid N-acyltransferase
VQSNPAAEGAGVLVRPASRADLGAVIDVYEQAVADGGATCELSGVPPSGRAELLAERLDRFGLWVAQDSKGPIVGWIALSPYDPKPCFQRTASVSTYVARGWRGRNVGTALREHVIEEARARGLRTLISRVWTTNEGGAKLARRVGSQEVGYLREVVEHEGRLIDCRLFQQVL